MSIEKSNWTLAYWGHRNRIRVETCDYLYTGQTSRIQDQWESKIKDKYYNMIIEQPKNGNFLKVIDKFYRMNDDNPKLISEICDNLGPCQDMKNYIIV